MSFIYSRSYLYRIILTMIIFVASHAYAVIPKKGSDGKNDQTFKAVSENKAAPLKYGFLDQIGDDKSGFFKEGEYGQLTLSVLFRRGDECDVPIKERKCRKILDDSLLSCKKKKYPEKTTGNFFFDPSNKINKHLNVSPLTEDPDRGVYVDATDPRCQKTQVFSKRIEASRYVDAVSVSDVMVQFMAAFQLFYKKDLNLLKRRRLINGAFI